MKQDLSVSRLIFKMRYHQVILDSDLAVLYGVETKALNQAVKRNKNRFPPDFMFQLNRKEKEEVVTNCDRLKTLKFSTQMPYAFTEQGVAMLSGVLRSKKAVEVNISIMRAFVAMRRFLCSLQSVEQKLLEHDNKFDEVFKLIEDNELLPEKGIFFDGQVFDAHKFVVDLIKSAKKSIVLIDNYIDESVLVLFSQRKNVAVTIYTQQVSEQLLCAVKKFNEQYEPVIVHEFTKAHDRFLIIDGVAYHFGASLKDLGKKWFAFSRFEKESANLLLRL